MMAGTQSMALIIQASTAESSRPPQKEPKPLTSISLCSSFLTLPSLLSSVVVTCNLVLSLSLSGTKNLLRSPFAVPSLCLFKSVCLSKTLNAHCMSIYSKLM